MITFPKFVGSNQSQLCSKVSIKECNMKTFKKKYYISFAMVVLFVSFITNFFSDLFSNDLREFSDIVERCDSCKLAPPCDGGWCHN